jgi:type II secretory pathway component PulF
VSQANDKPEPDITLAELSHGETAQLTGYLAELSATGSPLAEGLRAAAEEAASRRLKKSLLAMAIRLERGESLGDVLSSDAVGLPSYVIGFVRAGVRTGQLAEVLTELAEYHRTTRELRRNVFLATAYPLFLLVAVVGVFVFTFSVVTPSIMSLFEDFETDLPEVTQAIYALTQIVQAVVAWFVSAWRLLTTWPGLLTICVVTILLAATHVRLRDKPAYRRARGVVRWLCCTLPIFGPLMMGISLTGFARFVHVLLQQQVPLPEALRLTADSMADANIAEVSRHLARETSAGRPLSEALAETSRLPSLLLPWIRWGERSDRLPEAFAAIAEMCEVRAQLRITLLARILPPLAFIVVGATAVGAISSVALPLVGLIQNLS